MKLHGALLDLKAPARGETGAIFFSRCSPFRLHAKVPHLTVRTLLARCGPSPQQAPSRSFVPVEFGRSPDALAVTRCYTVYTTPCCGAIPPACHLPDRNPSAPAAGTAEKGDQLWKK